MAAPIGLHHLFVGENGDRGGFLSPSAGAHNTMNLDVSLGSCKAILSVVKDPKLCPNKATDLGVDGDF
jgi:hypothetical protein